MNKLKKKKELYVKYNSTIGQTVVNIILQFDLYFVYAEKNVRAKSVQSML